MPTFRAPMINLYSRDLSRAAKFYSQLGFVEAFRTPDLGEPLHIELTLDGFTLGIATMEAAKEHHSGGRRAMDRDCSLDGRYRCRIERFSRPRHAYSLSRA